MDVDGVEIDEAAEVFGLTVFLLVRPRVAKDRGLTGLHEVIAFEILLLADEIPEILSLRQ